MMPKAKRTVLMVPRKTPAMLVVYMYMYYYCFSARAGSELARRHRAVAEGRLLMLAGIAMRHTNLPPWRRPACTTLLLHTYV